MIVTKTDLDICMVGMTMEDCDEDVWAKRPDGMWAILDGDGNPAPIAHTARFLADHCSPLTLIGVSERLQAYFANQGIQKAAEAASVALSPDTSPMTRDWTPPSVGFLHELVKKDRYFVQSNHSEELMWGCNEHIDTADSDVVTGAAFCTDKCTDIVDVLKWIEQHEKERHA